MPAAIEQNHDDNGIIWPAAIAPFQIAIVPINLNKSEAVRAECEKLYENLSSQGVEVLYMDEEKARLGVMLANTELMGIPHRVVIGDRCLEKGLIEYKGRADEEKQEVALDGLLDFITSKLG